MAASERVPTKDGASLPVLLVVDDVVLVRLLIADSLRARGFQVIEAADGAGLAVHAVLTDIYNARRQAVPAGDIGSNSVPFQRASGQGGACRMMEQRLLALAVPHELAVFPREETLVGTHPN